MKTSELRVIKAHWLAKNELHGKKCEVALFDALLWSWRWRLFCSRDGLEGGASRVAALVLGAFLALGTSGCHEGPSDLVTVAQYPDGSFSVDVYDADGTLATTAHLPSDARMADAFPASKGDQQ